MLAAGGFDDLGGGIGGVAGFGEGTPPEGVAGESVECEQGGFWAAWGAEEGGAVHERGFCVGPGAGDAAEVGAQVAAPADLARGGVEAGQVAVGAQGVEGVADQRGGGAGGGELGLLVRLADLAESGGPEFGAVRGIAGLDGFVFEAVVGEDVEAVALDGGGGVTGSEVLDLPGEAGSCGWPFGQEAGFGRSAIAGGTAPLGVIGGWQEAREGQDQEEWDGRC